VRNAVRPLRIEAAASLTQCRFETEPGEQAQADWGQVRVRFESEPAEVHIFVLTLGDSRRAWADGYKHERMESLLTAHESGFAHFGCVPREALYDRMRTVIQVEGDGTGPSAGMRPSRRSPRSRPPTPCSMNRSGRASSPTRSAPTRATASAALSKDCAAAVSSRTLR
jgi:hypothetical protein